MVRPAQRALHGRRDGQLAIDARFFEPLQHAAKIVDAMLGGDAIGLDHGELYLARGECADALFLAGQPAGIDNDELARSQPAHAVLAVAREPGQVVHERVARAREHVEERGFADVGAADQSNYWKHVREPLTNLLRSAACGLAVLGILIYFARKLRFLRSGSPQSAFARDGQAQTPGAVPASS